MPTDIAIKIENLTKVYKLYGSPQDRLVESLHPLRKKYHHDFHALNNVTFEVKKGETVGIIGRNGSGKSTLLKIVTGVLTPSGGSVNVEGRISALLELGAGFNPELTGIDNIYFNATIMGYTRAEIDEKLEAILSFADIGEFVYQPIKTYSSGMFVRLAFAVAINVDPDILIIDEALAVGDNVFQQKCYKRFKAFQDEGKTIIFVSHSLENVIAYCTRTIVLDSGTKMADASPKEAVDVYKRILASCYTENEPAKERVQEGTPSYFKDVIKPNPNATVYGNGKASILDFALLDAEGQPNDRFLYDEPFTIIMKVKFHEELLNPIFAYTIRDLKGLEITGTNTLIAEVPTGSFNSQDYITIKFDQIMNLRAGKYSLCLGCTGYVGDDLHVYNRLYDILLFEVIASRHSFATGFYDLHSHITVSQQS
jgi:ABC-type polysaccharide/polyol phosphate transport system, ATPase component